MYWPDVLDLKAFYHTPLGKHVAWTLRRTIAALWPETRGDTMLGIGYATPVLAGEAQDILACMPAMQGAVPWPNAAKNCAFLASEAELPLPDNHINRVVVMHALENSETMREMLQEIWRVLTPGGRALFIVPHRHGLWARAGSTPFSYGQPFNAMQLRRVLVQSEFTPLRSRRAVFLPPIGWAWAIRRGGAWIEHLGHMASTLLGGALGGVLVMEAEKQLYALRREHERATYSYRLPRGAAQPALPALQPRAPLSE